jgi:hypothetical protein
VALAALIAIGGWAVVGSAQQPATQPRLPGAPLGSRGEAVYPAFEGWGPHKDGQIVILIGYFNRNTEQSLDISIGPNNRIEPGGPDYGQPTHFEPGRQWGVFSIQVPKDFDDKRLTWTLVANGQTAQVQFSMNPPYRVDFFRHAGSGNTPPAVKFAPEGPELVGPPRGIAQTLTATVGQPLLLKLWVRDQPSVYPNEPNRPPTATPDGAPARGADQAGRGTAATGRGVDNRDGRGRGDHDFDISAAAGRNGNAAPGIRGSGPQPDIAVAWHRHRGPAKLTLADETIRLFRKDDDPAWTEATTTATFSVPGEYVLRAQVNDKSGDGGRGEQCCWTSAHVRVTVK